MADRPVPHEQHDLELVAASAAGDATPDGAARARQLVETCTDCASLAADLGAIAAATRDLPGSSTVTSTARAPRDFRLSPADAARLRQRRIVDRIAAVLSGGAVAFGRPLGAALATFGIVGILVGSAGLTPAGGLPASGPSEMFTTATPGPGGPGAQGPAGTPEPDGGIALQPQATDMRQQGEPKAATEDPVSAAGPPDWLVPGSILLLVLGGALLAAGFAGHRSRTRQPRA